MKSLNAQNVNANNKFQSTLNKTVKHSALAALLTTALVSHSTMAAVTAPDYQRSSTKEEQINKEEIGFGTGAVLGAIFGGPVGAFVVGVTGSYIAKHLNAKENINDLTVALDDTESKKQQLTASYQRKLQALELAHQQELLAFESKVQHASQLQAENLLMSLQFTTGSSEIQPHYEGQLVALANMLRQSPELQVDLSGYTDLQGDERQNLALSKARAKAVKQALTAHGVEPKRIALNAFGEQAPVVANHQKEVSFYDRRVVIKLNSTQTNQRTANNR